MSASPSGPPSDGRTPTPNAGQPLFVRKSKPADPLRQRKPPRPVRAAPISKPSGPKQNGLKVAGGVAKSLVPGKHMGPGPAGPNGTSSAQVAPQDFTQTPEGTFQDFPLYTTKKAIRDGLRYHIARFASKKDIDPSNQDEFTRPVSLHRRDPKQLPPGKSVKGEDLSTGLPLDDKEREKAEIARMEKEAQRAADLAQIAPTGNNASAMASKKSAAFRNEKTTQVYHIDETEEDRQLSELKYEEKMPWHLEDADNKHTWVGTYEAALSNINVILIIDGGSFKMVPLEKWYKFNQKNQFKTLTIEEAEEKMKAKYKAPRWAMHSQEQQEEALKKQETRRQLGNLFHVKGESNTFKQSGKTETQDADELDIDDDLFQDDDEQATVEPDNDEDTKNATEKIKREQRGANLFGEGDENEVEKEAKAEEKEEEEKKKLGKSMKKALMKRERNYLYDSDENPYTDSSGDETSDDEKKKEQERRKEEEAKLKAKSSSKLPSGASSKGTNTPSGRVSKHGDPSKMQNHLKRPGSPNLSASETSGNESSRKKHKKKHVSSSAQPTGTSTPRSPSRPMSPAPASQPTSGTSPRKSSIIKLNLNPSKLSEIQSAPPNPSAAMSDGEATAGEMSDGAPRKKTIKLRLGNKSPTPSASRAGSPANGSRAGSPAASAIQIQGQNPTSAKPSAPSPKPVTVDEIVAALPADGISLKPLLKMFAGRVVDDAAKKRFIDMVKNSTNYDKQSKLLTRKT